MTHTGVSLHLIGEKDREIEFFRQLLKPREELVEFLQVNASLGTTTTPVVVPIVPLDQSNLVLPFSRQVATYAYGRDS